MAALIDCYLSDLLANTSSYATEIDTLFNNVSTTAILNTVVDSLSSEELQTLFATIFGDNSVVSDTVVNALYNSLTSTDRIAGLSDSQMNTLYTNVLADAYITDTRLANIKANFNLTSDGYMQIIAKYLGVTYSNEEATFDAIINSLSDAQINSLWSAIKSSSSMTNEVYNSLGEFYLKYDSTNYEVAVNPSYGYSIYSYSNTVYTAPYRLISGSYDDVTGVYATGAPSGTVERLLTYTGVNSTGNYRFYNYSGTSNDYFDSSATRSRYYSVSTATGSSYIYYTVSSGRYYYYSTHGEYYRYSADDSYTSFKNTTFQPETIRYFLKNIFYSQNSTAAMNEVMTSLYSSISMTSNLESYLTSLASTLSRVDKQEIIVDIFDAYSAYLSVSIPTATTREAKISSIAAKASEDATYYNYVLHDSTYGIDDSISSVSKLAVIDSILNNESGTLAASLVSKNALLNTENEEYYLSRALSANALFFKNEITSLLGAGLGDSLISYDNIGEIIDLMVEATPSLFNTIVSSLTLNDVDKKAIISEICYYDAYQEYIDPNYTGSDILINLLDSKGYGLDVNNPTDLANLEATLTSLCTTAGININNYTDYVGVYALASSDGIEQGEFLPDNVKLIYLDEYLVSDNLGNPINDSTWRGGTASSVNNYYVLDEYGEPTTTLNTSCVNYKIYYMMKQLKKSIATTVFKVELKGPDRTYPTNIYTVTNNVLECYDTRNKVITFYIASNADEINASEFVVNTLSSYELSYNAIFKEGSVRSIAVGTGLVPGNILTSKIGSVQTYTFIIQAEDRTVETEYFVNIIITAPKTLDSLINLQVNNGVNYAATPITDIDTVDITGGSYDEVNSTVGTLNATYITKNLPSGMDMHDNINIYRYANTGQTLANNCIPTNKVTNYSYSSVLNNGRVVVTTIGDSAFNEDYTWDDGTLVINLNISSHLQTGDYILEVRLSSTEIYYIVFSKAASDACAVEEISFGDQPFVPAGATSNSSDPVEIPYGTLLTETYFTTINGETLIPNYLSAFTFSPLATYEITSVTVDATDPTKKIYNVNYLITAENGVNTSTFTHIIEEYVINDEAIATVYVDGGIVDDDPVGSSNPNFDLINNKYSLTFGREKTPTYRFDYNLENVYFGEATDYLRVEYAGTDLTTEQQNQYFAIEIQEGIGFTIEFFVDAPPREYQFTVYYESGLTAGVPTYLFKTGTWLSWELPLTSISITKDKNVRSYLENATFITETMLTTIETLVSVDEISTFNYADLRASLDREIVCLPSGIYYNLHEYTSDTLNNHRSLIYIVGLVSKTNISTYKPMFEIPEDSMIYRTANFEYTPYAYYDSYSALQIGYFYVSEDGAIILNSAKEGIDLSGTANEFIYNGTTYIALDYFPYTYFDGYGNMQTTYFYANSDGTMILDSSGTLLSTTGNNYEFVYNGTTYSAYEYIAYNYTDSYGDAQIAYFYVRTDKMKFLNSSGLEITVDGNRYKFTYLGYEYTLKTVYQLTENTFNTSSTAYFYVSENGIWVKDSNKSSIIISGTKDEFVYNNITYTYNSTDIAYRYTPYTYVDEDNLVQNIVFLVSEDQTDFKDISGKDITFSSGNYDEFVLATDSGSETVYTTYTISITDGIAGIDYIFEKIEYSYVDTGETKTIIFYVSQDGTIIQNDSRKNVIITSGNRSQFVFNGVTYTLNTVLETANYTYENFSLEADYNPQSGTNGVNFNYIRYRIYSEKYEDIQKALYYTDYKVAVQDITNNVRFNISIDFDGDITLNNTLDDFRLFLELINKSKDLNLSSWTLEEHFILNNRMGMFATYTYDELSPSTSFTHGTFTTNTSGGYVIHVDLPSGYTFSYTILDPIYIDENDIEIPITGNETDDFVILGDALLSRIVTLNIVIEETTPQPIDWGEHIETDLLEPYVENSPNVD